MALTLCRKAAEYADLTPDQASEMTPFDLQLCIEAGIRRCERQRDLAAWVAAHLMNATGHYRTHPIDMDQLLGPEWTHQRMRRERGLTE